MARAVAPGGPARYDPPVMRIGPPVTSFVRPLPTNPYHISRAYGVRQAAPAAVAPAAAAERSEGLANLIAATVPGGVHFDSDGSPVARPAMTLYRHPADRNAAATGVMLGRMVDVNG